jgi:hypothetical protein
MPHLIAAADLAGVEGTRLAVVDRLGSGEASRDSEQLVHHLLV